MKFSQALIPTLRQAPADAEVISHQLLMRAGMIRKVAAGIYEFLPLGLKSLRKVEQIIREEMDNAGCLEVFLPHMVPADLWLESGRWQKYGPELLRIRDRHERDYCFGPTHEEVICDLVRGSISSYKALPLNLYQIQTKFRDEIRPRFGLMRGREFLMKDSYSFHTSFDDLDREYKKMYGVYAGIFKRCGLSSRAVEADTGAIGGSSSHEFMVLAETGEDVIASCPHCEYAANLEKATFKVVSEAPASAASMTDVSTPAQKSIEEVSAFLKVQPHQLIKTLVYAADDAFAVVCLAGDREVSEVKLGHVLGSPDMLRMALDEEVVALTGVPVGFLGPVGLAGKMTAHAPKTKCRILFDQSLAGLADAVSGANRADFHTVHIDLDRDLGLNWQKNREAFCDVAQVRSGDVCPRCGEGMLALVRGIEVGHIFKLGDKYSKPMKVHYLDAEGKEQVPVMGCYGVGVGRTLAACVEQSHDDKGIIWPSALSPFDVHLMNLDASPELAEAAGRFYDDLRSHGVSVLWDDRDERAGVKFNDADLIGIPLQIMLGKKGLARGCFEYKVRKTGAKGDLGMERAVEGVKEVLGSSVSG